MNVTESGRTLPERGLPSFEDFYGDHYASSVRLAMALVGRWGVAEELTQDAFLALYARWDRVSQYESPEGWIRRVVVNRSVSVLRRRAVEARLILRLAVERPVLIDPPESDRDLWRHVARLPKRQAQVTALVYVEGLTPAEAATVLGCDETTARTHLRRARLALAERLGTEVEEP